MEDLLASDEVWGDNFPLEVQCLQLPEYFCHDILRPTLGPDTKVPLGTLESTTHSGIVDSTGNCRNGLDLQSEIELLVHVALNGNRGE